MLTNYGQDYGAWGFFGVILLGLFFLGGIVVGVRMAWRAKTRWDMAKAGIMTAGSMFVFAAYIFCFFVAFGPGERTELPEPEEEGIVQMYEGKLAEKEIGDIRDEAYEKKPEWLKKQDDKSFEEEAREADEYIKKALKGEDE